MKIIKINGLNIEILKLTKSPSVISLRVRGGSPAKYYRGAPENDKYSINDLQIPFEVGQLLWKVSRKMIIKDTSFYNFDRLINFLEKKAKLKKDIGIQQAFESYKEIVRNLSNK